MSKKLWYKITLIISLIVIALTIDFLPKEEQQQLEVQFDKTLNEILENEIASAQVAITVSEVIDGDTIKLSNGQTVRYIGIDTPEANSECYAEIATQENSNLVLGKEVTLEKDISETDRYGRLLRYVYIDELFVNDYLVKNGFAEAKRYPPDIKYAELFGESMLSAQDNGLGMWLDCKN